VKNYSPLGHVKPTWLNQQDFFKSLAVVSLQLSSNEKDEFHYIIVMLIKTFSSV